MRLIKQLKAILNDLRLSDVYPITHLNNRCVFEASNGMIGSTIRVEGVPFDTETNELMNQLRREWKNTIKGLSDAISLHVTIHRETVNPMLGGTFPNEFTHKLNACYEEKFSHTRLYKNTIYLTLIYKGVTSGKSGWLISKAKRLSEKTVKQARAMIRAHQMESLEKVRAQMLSSLAKFKPVLLGSRDEEVGHSELLEFLGLAINGGKSAPFRFPKATLPVSESIATMKKGLSLYPTGNIGQYLFRYRLFFGRAIQFEGVDSRFAAMLSIKDYPSETSSLISDSLLHLDTEFIATHTFSVEARDVSLALVKKQAKQLKSVDDAGKSQIEQLEELLDGIASRQDVLGYHHHSLMIFADTVKELDNAVNAAIGEYKDEGITAIREDAGQEAAFFAQIPTNLKYIARSVLISGDNFTDFSPLHNYRLGYRDGNHLGSAVTLLETAAKTPYFFNYHLPSANKSLTAGHAMIIGVTGAGKTALMTWLDAQASRYHGFTFVFDVKRGFDFYIRACGGYYAVLSPNDKSVRFNPFQLPDMPTNREFCKKWLIQLVKEKEDDHIDVETQELLGDCVNYAYDSLAPEHRFLSNVVKLLPITFNRWVNLRRWLRANGQYDEGQYAYLFDNAEDGFKLHRKMGFDMTYFIEKEPAYIRTAVVMYLLHRLELIMNSHSELLSIYMDEAWKFLSDPYWQGVMADFLAKIRSKNAHFIFATQTPETILESKIHPIIMANTATMVLFANNRAVEKTYKEGFHLTQQEFEAIKDTQELKRLFLVKQGSDSLMCRLNLSGMTEELMILSPSESEVALGDKIRAEVGDNPAVWIPHVFAERENAAKENQLKSRSV